MATRDHDKKFSSGGQLLTREKYSATDCGSDSFPGRGWETLRSSSQREQLPIVLRTRRGDIGTGVVGAFAAGLVLAKGDLLHPIRSGLRLGFEKGKDITPRVRLHLVQHSAIPKPAEEKGHRTDRRGKAEQADGLQNFRRGTAQQVREQDDRIT